MIVVSLGLYGFVYTRIVAKNDTKKIWVPPKPKPQLPFGMGPPAEPLKPEDFKETTYREYEISQLKEAAQSLVTGAVISFFMAYQFKVYMSYLIQSISTPMGVIDHVVFKKYVLGTTKGDNGAELYGEHFRQPTEESIKIAENLAAARAAGVGSDATSSATPESSTAAESSDAAAAKLTPLVAKSAISSDEPRVEELPASQ